MDEPVPDPRTAFELLVTQPIASLGRAEAEALLVAVRVARGALDSEHVRVVARLDELAELADEQGGDPLGVAAERCRTSRREAERATRRAEAAAATPGLLDALAAGAVSGEHLDVLAAARRRVDAARRDEVFGDPDELVRLATTLAPDAFGRALRRRRQARDQPGARDRFERQRQSTSLRWWTDPGSGMLRLVGEFDPELGMQLTARISAAAEALFHDARPDTCPDDPFERIAHLRALALVALITGAAAGQHGGFGASTAGTDIVVVIDAPTLLRDVHADSRIELPGDAELPVETVRRMACGAGLLPAVLGGDGVLLDLGRRRRLADLAQRRALRAMYRTCGIGPGCEVPFEQCEPHHIDWWRRDGGATDIDNLVPACHRCHHGVHEDGWRLSIRPSDRRLTVTLPDGTVVHRWPDSRPAVAVDGDEADRGEARAEVAA